MKVGPAAAAKSLHETIGFADSPRTVEDILYANIETIELNSSDLPDELVSRWTSSFTAYIDRELTNAVEDSRVVSFEWSSVEKRKIQGSCFVVASDDEATKISKIRRAQTLRYRDALRDLSDDEFETLGGKILSLWNCTDVLITQSSRDQGIDFAGKVPLGEMLSASFLPNGVERNMFSWVLGQAKRYNLTQIGTATLRELVGSVDLLRFRAFGSDDPFPDDFRVLLCDPALVLLITTGDISTNARRLLKRSGVVGLDGLQLCTLLADHGIAQVERRFCHSTFHNWLHGQPNPNAE